ncbi:MAG TPA: hypothetical protein VF487_20240 [Chitinophagaceae bacterium]
MMEIIPQIAWLLFCLFFAYANYVVIEKVNERIRHGINGIFGVATSLYFGLAVYWLLGLSMLFIARLFFDSFLSLLRFQRINYVSLKPKSIIDQVEKFVFGMDGYTPKIIYLIVIIVLNIFA